jgi:hypothetical protein
MFDVEYYSLQIVLLTFFVFSFGICSLEISSLLEGSWSRMVKIVCRQLVEDNNFNEVDRWYFWFKEALLRN